MGSSYLEGEEGCWDSIWGWPESHCVPGGTDLGGVAVGWPLRPWEPRHSSELRHKVSTSKRTIILWGRSACLSNAQGQKIRISAILLHCMSGYHYPEGIKSSPFLSSSRSYYLCFLMANSNLELYGGRDCGYSP